MSNKNDKHNVAKHFGHGRFLTRQKCIRIIVVAGLSETAQEQCMERIDCRKLVKASVFLAIINEVGA